MLLLVTLGIAASLLAYAISPTVRHAVGHAAHSVKSTVGKVFDRDKNEHKARRQETTSPPNDHHEDHAAGHHARRGELRRGDARGSPRVGPRCAPPRAPGAFRRAARGRGSSV